MLSMIFREMKNVQQLQSLQRFLESMGKQTIKTSHKNLLKLNEEEEAKCEAKKQSDKDHTRKMEVEDDSFHRKKQRKKERKKRPRKERQRRRRR